MIVDRRSVPAQETRRLIASVGAERLSVEASKTMASKKSVSTLHMGRQDGLVRRAEYRRVGGCLGQILCPEDRERPRRAGKVADAFDKDGPLGRERQDSVSCALRKRPPLLPVGRAVRLKQSRWRPEKVESVSQSVRPAHDNKERYTHRHKPR